MPKKRHNSALSDWNSAGTVQRIPPLAQYCSDLLFRAITVLLIQSLASLRRKMAAVFSSGDEFLNHRAVACLAVSFNPRVEAWTVHHNLNIEV